MTNFKSAALFTVFGFLLASLTGSPKAAPDQTLGMALMWARVQPDGTLTSGAGAVSASHGMGNGSYSVTFNRSLSLTDCFLGAHLYQDGFAFADHTSGNDVIVFTTDAAGSNADRRFQLFVFCDE